MDATAEQTEDFKRQQLEETDNNFLVQLPFRVMSYEDRQEIYAFIHERNMTWQITDEKIWKSTLPEAKRIREIIKSEGYVFGKTDVRGIDDDWEVGAHIYSKGEKLIHVATMLYWERGGFTFNPLQIDLFSDKKQIDHAIGLAKKLKETEIPFELTSEKSLQEKIEECSKKISEAQDTITCSNYALQRLKEVQ